MSGPLQRLEAFWRERSLENSFRLDGAVPLRHALAYGVQHVLAMFVSNVAGILILFAAISAKLGSSVDPNILNNALRSAIFMAGLGTLVQAYPLGGKIGTRLPIVMGTSFTYIGVLTMIGATYGLGTMFISVMIAGLAVFVLGFFAHKWSRFIKPVVCALVVIALGLSLFPIGVKDFIGVNQSGVIVDGVFQFSTAWPYILVAFITMVTTILWQIFTKGIHRNLSILMGLVVGFACACCFIPYNQMVDFSAFHFQTVSDFIDVPRPIFTLVPLSWGDFNIAAIAIVFLIYIVSIAENTGALSTLTSAIYGRDPEGKEIRGLVTCTALSGAFCGFFGTIPNSVYAQNASIASQTKIINRFCMFATACILLAASFFTPIATLLRCIPACVLAGTMMSLFGSIAVVGMQMLGRAGFNKKNILIASIALCLGYGLTLVTEFTGSAGSYTKGTLNYLVVVLSNPVANVFVFSFILSYVIPESFNNPDTPEEK